MKNGKVSVGEVMKRWEEIESWIRRCNPVHFKENSDLESGL